MSGSVRDGWHPSGLCSQFLCDVASFGDASRTDDARTYVRKGLYDGLRTSFEAEGIPLAECYHEDRGDGVMVVVPPRIDPALLITSVAQRLRAEVRRHNEFSSAAVRMRLRVAVHTGDVHWDGAGLVGTAVNHAFRILDAEPFKELLRASGADLALIVSQRVYDDVVRHGRGLVDRRDYRQVEIAVKETHTTAWVTLPGRGLPDGPPEERADGETAELAPAGGGEHTVVPAATEDALEEFLARTLDEDPRKSHGAWGYEGGALPNDVLFALVDRALDLPQMAGERTRERVVGALPVEIRSVIPRSSDARSDTYEIIRTCLDYPGGLQALLHVLQGFAGESLALARLKQAIAGLLLGP
ncbi:hypothetical protein ACFY4C_24910 [Actinomadura viridis]|uniref:effector-associated domain 2-containing protein n=1 Tax=Actinomadura viridis TaxID=58110 RepID=UPI00368BD827